jgi:hypothetical protein
MAHDSKKANRLRQQRHRAAHRAVTNAATVEGLSNQLDTANDCIKCSQLTLRYHRPVVCAEHAKVVEVGLAKLGLTDGAGAHLKRNKILTGTDIARVSDARHIGHGHGGTRHGFTDKLKPIKSGNFTGRADMLPDVLEVQGIAGHGREEFIKTILPWFTELVHHLWDTLLENNPQLTIDDLFDIVPLEAAGILDNELHQPKGKRSWD